MNNKTKKILHSSEFYVGVIIILFCLLIQARSGQFFTGNNLVDILRSFTIPVMFCMGELMVLISGGVDCSFPAAETLRPPSSASRITVPDKSIPSWISFRAR